MMKGTHHSQQGITLIELMIVVVVIGILATAAVFGFTRQTRKARASEVNAMFAELKVRQENFHLEHGEYLSTGADDTDFFPTASPPTGSPQAYDLTDSADPPSPQDAKFPGPAWKSLRLSPPKKELYCVYVAIAGNGGDDTNIGTLAAAAPFSFGGAALPVPATDWFYAMAECDFDGDGTPSRYFTLSGSEETIVENKGE